MEHVFEFGNSISLYFITSLEAFPSVKNKSLDPLHLTLFDAKTHRWNMALMFKRNASTSFCRDWNTMTSSASLFHSFQ